MKVVKPSGKNICQSIGNINDMCKFSEFSVTVYYPHGAVSLYKGNFKKYKGKFGKSVFWHFELSNLLKICCLALVRISELLTHFLTHILLYPDITNVRSQMRHLCQKCQKGHIWYMSYIDMAIWVLKDASEPRECRPMLLNDIRMGLMA